MLTNLYIILRQYIYIGCDDNIKITYLYCVSTINYDAVQNVVKYDAVRNVCCMTLHLLYDQTNIYLPKDYIQQTY